MRKTICFSTVALSVALFSLVAALVFAGYTESFDSAVYAAVLDTISPPLTFLAKAVSFIGSAPVIIPMLAVLLILPGTRVNFGVPAAGTVIISAALNWVLKHIFARPRPEILWLVEETGFSFPSGHSMNNMALYTVLVLLVFLHVKNARVWFTAGAYVLVFTIGLSRVYLGVHYASDVIAAFLMGYAVAVGAYCVFIRLRGREKTRGG